MTIYGSDISHYDATDPRAMFAEGIVFQTHKAGGDAADAELSGWWALARPYRGRVLLGAYWVLYPGSPTSRADAFLARLDSQCPGWRDGPFILQVDCEKWGGDSSTVPNRQDIKAFCDRLVAKCPKLRPMVYVPQWVYGNTLAGLGYPLWASAYVNGTGGFKALYPGDGSSKWDAYSGQVPEILQYTSKATIGGQTTCDANAYRGTLEELTALLAPGWEEDNVNTISWADDIVANPRQRADAATNKTTSVSWALGDMYAQIYNLRDSVAAMNTSLGAAIKALAAKDRVDEAALAAALVPGVVAGVLAALPTDADDVTVQELTEAIRALIIPAAG